MKGISLLMSIGAIAGLLLGCGNPQSGEQETEPSSMATQELLDDKAGTASLSEASSAKSAPAPSVRCGPVRTEPCGGGEYCHIDCCNEYHDSIRTACGSCQHFGNSVCAYRGGLKAAYWRPYP
jgi:hypothetical protein